MELMWKIIHKNINLVENNQQICKYEVKTIYTTFIGWL